MWSPYDMTWDSGNFTKCVNPWHVNLSHTTVLKMKKYNSGSKQSFQWLIPIKKLKLVKIIVLKKHDTMTIVVTFFGQHYFHNVDLRFAPVNIMKIMLTKKSDTIVHNDVKISAFPEGQYFGPNYFHNLIEKSGKPSIFTTLW